MKKEYWILFTLAFLQFTNIVDFMIMMPLGDELMKMFHISPAQFSIIVSSYSISAGMSGFLSAFFIDRFDRKTSLMWIYAGFAVGTFACGLAPSYETLVAARFLTGMFGGIIGALVLSIIGDIIPVERRGTAMGIVTAAFSVASVVGVPSGLFFANKLGWHSPFIILGFTGIAVLSMVFFVIPSINAHQAHSHSRRSPKEIIKMLINSPNQQIALLFSVLLIMGQFTMIPFLTPYMIRNVGFTPDQIPFIYLVGGGLTIFTSPIFGKLADKIGRKKVFYTASILSLIPMIAITNMPPVHIAVALSFTGIFFVFISGRMIPAMALMTSVVQPENRGSFMSLMAAMQQFAAGFSSLIAGAIIVQPASGGLQNFNYVGYLAVIGTFIAMYIATKLVTLEGN